MSQSFKTDSDIEIQPSYAAASADPSAPGEFPYTRGLYATMYRGRLWTMRQYAGFASARETNERFRSAESVEKVRLDTRDFQFLFAEGDQLTFMDKLNYDQVSLPRDLLGDAAEFLQDGMDVVMETYDEKPISVQLPDTIEALIVEADAVVKGQTASSSYKPAVLENGVRVMVPPHIGAGTRIVVDVYEQTYVKRAEG